MHRNRIFSSDKNYFLLLSTIIFCCFHSGSVFHPEFCFSDEAWRLLQGETSINSRKHISLYLKKNIYKSRSFLIKNAILIEDVKAE